MARLYVATFKDVAITLAQDLFSILPAANKPVTIHAVYISQKTDVGDAAEEGLTIEIQRGDTTVGSGGSALTGNPLMIGTAADAASVRANDTTEVSAGTPLSMHVEVWNIRVPWVYHPAPEDRIMSINAEFIAVQLITAPADSITASGTLVYEEA